MPYDHEDFIKSVAAKTVAGKDPSRIRIALQAAVDSEHLVGDPHWDKFLSYLQGAIEITYEKMEIIQAELARPIYHPEDALQTMLIELRSLQEQASVMEWVITLPSALINNVEGLVYNLEE